MKNDREKVRKMLHKSTKERVIEFTLDYREGYFGMIKKYWAEIKKGKSITMWMIASARGGLYYGTSEMLKDAAIHAHCTRWGQNLDWKECQARGDYAIKVKVLYQPRAKRAARTGTGAATKQQHKGAK